MALSISTHQLHARSHRARPRQRINFRPKLLAGGKCRRAVTEVAETPTTAQAPVGALASIAFYELLAPRAARPLGSLGRRTVRTAYETACPTYFRATGTKAGIKINVSGTRNP